MAVAQLRLYGDVPELAACRTHSSALRLEAALESLYPVAVLPAGGPPLATLVDAATLDARHAASPPKAVSQARDSFAPQVIEGRTP